MCVERWSVGVVTALVVFVLIGSANTSYAQCDGCAPDRVMAGSGVNYNFNSNVPDDMQRAFNNAAGQWNDHFAAKGLARRFNTGCCFEISVDSTVPSGIGAIWTQGQGIRISPTVAYSPDYNLKVLIGLHELGHQAGWGDSPCFNDGSVMGSADETGTFNATSFRSADECAFDVEFQGGSYDAGWSTGSCRVAQDCSPILIGFGEGGIDMIEPRVLFDLGGGLRSYSWPSPASASGFLVLDRDGDGLIADGRELFGNATPVGWGFEGHTARNGFDALAFFDQTLNGGNANGYIDPGDTIYAQLRIWFDDNANGITDAGELVPLDALGVQMISLDARESMKSDKLGNEYRFRSQVVIEKNDGHLVNRFAYDVFVVSR